MSVTNKEKKREPGFYWVLWEEEWQVSQWDGYWWWLTGIEYEQSDKHFTEIKEVKLLNNGE